MTSQMLKKADAGCVEESVAEEVVRQASQLLDRANNVLSMASSKLEPVMLMEPTCCECQDEKTLQRAYPPLFSQLRSLLAQTEQSLAGIEDCLGRTTL